MKITDKTKKGETEYKWVEIGQVFKTNGCYYLATIDIYDEEEYHYNSINLNSGIPTRFADTHMVEVLEAELTVK